MANIGIPIHQEPRSIPVYEAKNRIQQAHVSIESHIDSLKDVITRLEARLCNVLTPEQAQDGVADSVSASKRVEALRSLPPPCSSLTSDLSAVAEGAEALARTVHALEFRLNALIERVES